MARHGHCCRIFAEKGPDVIVFLPGLGEIDKVEQLLSAKGVAEGDIFILHADLAANVIQEAKTRREKARVVLATSLAEVAMTIPDIDWVLDSGIGRLINEDKDVPIVIDYRISVSSETQREGQAGRAKNGGCLKFRHQQFLRTASDLPVSRNDMMRVIALEQYHEKIALCRRPLAFLSTEEMLPAEQEFESLHFETGDLTEALMKLSVPLPLSAVVLQARSYDVGYEAAAIVALKHEGRWKHTTTFTVDAVLAEVAGEMPLEPVIGRLDKVRDCFQSLCKRFWLFPSKLPAEYVLDRLAVAFLQAPERLIWSIKQVGSFLGEPLEHDCKDEFFVAALLSKPPYKQLRCVLRLPFSAWVQSQTGIIKPTRTFKFIGDSTFAEFRNDICQHLRSAHEYDMRHWLSQGGAWETDLAEDLAIAPKTDNTVMSPNGNRLMRQDRMVEPTWLQPNAEHICGGLRETSTLGVVFVGDADLSPGVDYGQVYARISQRLSELQDDGIH